LPGEELQPAAAQPERLLRFLGCSSGRHAGILLQVSSWLCLFYWNRMVLFLRLNPSVSLFQFGAGKRLVVHLQQRPCTERGESSESQRHGPEPERLQREPGAGR
ncbi:hypothetical protein GOODEAATRI_034164, partial [Goodea atripinnis]